MALKLGENLRGTLLAAGLSLTAATGAFAERAHQIVVPGCDTTGFPNADGSENISGPTRGAVYVDGLRAYDENGRACSVSMDVYQGMLKDRDDDQSSTPAPTPDQDTDTDTNTNPGCTGEGCNDII